MTHARCASGAELLTAVVGFTSLVVSPHIAMAASGDDTSSATLQEVVVTATRRAESAQAVPMSITALSAKKLETAHVETFQDYARLVPNLSYASGLGVFDRPIAIRGIYGSGTTAIYLDDMPIGFVDPRVVDLDRIEVLRGPQGTLFGSDSMGGAIRLITVAPDTAGFSGNASAEGSTLQAGTSGYQVSGTTNIPLIEDKAAARLTLYNGEDGSFINREWPDLSNPAVLDHKKVAGNEFTGVYLSGLVKVTPDLTIRVTGLGQQTLANGFPLSDYNPGTLTQLRLFDIPETARNRWGIVGLTVTYDAPIGTLTSSTSYFNGKTVQSEETSDYIALVFGTPPVPASSLVWNPDHTFTQELRFVSKLSGPLQFIGGLYFHEDGSDFVQYINPTGLNAASGGALGTDLIVLYDSVTDSKESAAYGELTYHLSKAWSVTGGLRYSRLQENTFVTETGIVAAGSPNFYGTQKQNVLTRKFDIQYQPTDDLNLYALASQGFRPGSPQEAPPEYFCGADYAAAGLTPADLSTYKSDSIWNYEVGEKSTFLDRRLRVDSAVYWLDWKGIQQYAGFQCGYDFTVNAGAARSRGAELELDAVPIDNLNVSLGLGFINAKITATSPEAFTRVGEPVQNTAPWTASLGADYSFPLAGRFQGFAHADYSYTDHSFSATNSQAQPRLREPYQLVDLRTGVTNGSWDLALFVNNLFNVHANLGDFRAESAELPGRIRWLINPPRKIGLQAVYRW